MILWPFKVDWRDRYSVTYAFQTEIKTSRTKREQRRAVRHTPRRTAEWTSRCYQTEFLALKRLMAKSADEQMVAADAGRQAFLGSSVNSGASSVSVAAVRPWMTEGRYLVLSGEQGLELAQIASVASSTVTLAAPLTRAYPAGAQIWAGMTGYPKQPLSLVQQTSQYGSVRVQFEVDPGSEPLASGSAEASFGGREAFVRKPNWRENVSTEVVRSITTSDMGYGVVHRFPQHDFTSFTRDATWLAASEDDIDYFVAFFERMKGRRGEFVAPRFERDMDLSASLSAGSAVMRVSGTATAAAYADDPVHTALLVCLRDGTQIYRTVESLVADGSESVFTLNATWPANIAIDDVIYVTWAPVCRLGSDEMTINWLSATVAEIRLAHMALEALDPET